MSDADLLTLTQWMSPAFPLGSFAYSHGLETAIANGDVCDAKTLEQWIATVLDHGSGRIDAALLCATMAAPPAKWREMAERARALAPSAERHLEAEALGTAFANTVNALGMAPTLPHLPLPVAVGAAAASLTVPAAQVAALYLQSFAANLVSCAVRTVPLGQTAGQKVLMALHPLCLQIGAEAVDQDIERIGSAAFGADLASMLHETQEVRLYRT